MESRRNIAIPRFRRSRFFDTEHFGKRLNCPSHTETEATVSIPKGHSYTNITVPIGEVSVLADVGADNCF